MPSFCIRVGNGHPEEEKKRSMAPARAHHLPHCRYQILLDVPRLGMRSSCPYWLVSLEPTWTAEIADLLSGHLPGCLVQGSGERYHFAVVVSAASERAPFKWISLNQPD